jgi:tripartite-type tricarboxylate transporter receptor subunit TctC
MKAILRTLLIAVASCAVAPAANAQAYPAKPVHLLLSSSPGSGSDTIGRVVAAGLTQAFGQQVIIDNRPGGGSNIGAQLAAKAPADGYTIFQVNMAHAVNATLYRNLQYDLVRDFAPVIQLATSPALVVVHPSLPVKSIADLVKLARAKPGVMNYGSAGTGTPTFLAAELFKGMAGTNIVHVPYRGGGEALNSVIAGETSIYFAPIATALAHAKQGKLRALAVTSAKRLALAPEYPTVAELGFSGYESGNWYGLLVPVLTPKPAIAAIHTAAGTALANPLVSKRLTDLGYITIGGQPEEFAAYIKSEIAKLGKIVRELDLKPE